MQRHSTSISWTIQANTILISKTVIGFRSRRMPRSVISSSDFLTWMRILRDLWGTYALLGFTSCFECIQKKYNCLIVVILCTLSIYGHPNSNLKYNHYLQSDCALKASDLEPDTVSLLHSVFKKDFELYEQVEKAGGIFPFTSEQIERIQTDVGDDDTLWIQKHIE